MTVAFLYAAVVLRSLLAFDGSERVLVLVLLAVWLLLLLTEPALSRIWPPYFALYVGAAGRHRRRPSAESDCERLLRHPAGHPQHAGDATVATQIGG